MPGIELKIMWEVAKGQQSEMKFDSCTVQLCNTFSCKANTDWEIKSDNMDVTDANLNMPNYFRPSMKTTADKRGSEVLPQKNDNNSVFFRNLMFGRHIFITGRSEQSTVERNTQESTICTPAFNRGGAVYYRSNK